MAARSSRRDRLKRSIPAFLLVCVVILGGGWLILLDSVSPGPIDRYAGQRIRAVCNGQVPCNMRLSELVPGSWDVFYEFEPTVPQAAVRRLAGDDQLHTAHSQRILVLTKNDRLVKRQYAHTGQAQPLAGELVFAEIESQPHKGWVSYAANTEFAISRCHTHEGGSPFGLHGGVYYLLAPAQSGAASAPPCPAA